MILRFVEPIEISLSRIRTKMVTTIEKQKMNIHSRGFDKLREKELPQRKIFFAGLNLWQESEK